MPRSDAALRQHTRLLLMYNLTPQVQVGRDVLRPMTAGLELGRFTAHVHAAGRLLPQLVFSEEVPDLSLAGAAAIAAWVRGPRKGGEVLAAAAGHPVRAHPGARSSWRPVVAVEPVLDLAVLRAW